MSETDDDNSDGLWLSISDLANRKGVDKSHISRKVAELEQRGLIATRDGPGKRKLVNIAEFDAAVGETTDWVKERSAETARMNRGFRDDAYDLAVRQRAQYDAIKAGIEVKQKLGTLVDVSGAKEVIAEVGEEIKRPLDQIALRADDVTAAARTGGASAVRTLLAQIVFDVRAKITEALGKLDSRSRGDGGAA